MVGRGGRGGSEAGVKAGNFMGARVPQIVQALFVEVPFVAGLILEVVVPPVLVLVIAIINKFKIILTIKTKKLGDGTYVRY